MASSRPRLSGILETVVYRAPGREAEVQRFYEDVLGLRPVRSWPAGTAYRAGASVYLVFDSERTSVQDLPHGASGSVHACFLAADGEYERWKDHLAREAIPIVDEITWGSGARSFYFHDPAGNLLEIAEGDLWPP
jgi:catechol 2,3-dioxygenase-like lactoylglutathione lyase family enzyme